MAKYDTVDIINPRQVALTEAGNATIVMNIEDYIAENFRVIRFKGKPDEVYYGNFNRDFLNETVVGCNGITFNRQRAQ